MRRTVVGVVGLALVSAGIVFIAAPPAMAVGCTSTLSYAMDYVPNPAQPTAVVETASSSAGTTCTTSFTVPADVTAVEYVIVAGGGGAGDDTASGGAGGAGGVVDDSLAVTPGQSIGVVVGAGGGRGVSGGDGANGANSSITAASTTLSAVGGGGGGGPTRPGLAGGSGGGGGLPSGAGGAGTAGQGYAGAAAGGVGTYGGGGGGAGSAATSQNGGSRQQFTWTTKLSYGGNGSPGSNFYETFPGTGGSQSSSAPLDGFDGIVYLRWNVSAPAAPTAVTGTPGDGSVTVSWTAPSTGGAPIDEYVVQYSSDGGSTWTDDSTNSDATSYTVTGLSNGTGYVFKVRAVNDANAALPNDVPPGPYSAATGTVTPAPAPPTPLPPSAPTNVVAIAGNSQAIVTWGAPVSPGSFPVSSYRVTASPGSQACITSSLSCTVSGLSNGTSYTFSVTALSGAGWGASASAGPVTPNTGPVPAPAPQPLPQPLTPGSSYLVVNGAPQQVEVNPNGQSNGLRVTGEDFAMSLDGLGPDGQPLDLGPDGVLVLDQERQASSSGRGFLSRSDVDFYVDPPVTAGSSAVVRSPRSSGTYVGTLVTDARGEFSGVVNLPDSIGAGDHVLQAVGRTSSGQPRALSIGVRVDAWIVLDQGTRVADGRHDRIRTSGTTAGIPEGARLTPWIRYGNRAEFVQGRATIVVQADGSFRWTRQIIRSRAATAYVSYTDIESNRVVWARIR